MILGTHVTQSWFPPAFDAAAGMLAPERRDAEWRIELDDLASQRRELGRGSFGTVLQYRWRRTDVAVKVINPAVPASASRLFQREFDIMTRMHHPNIVQLLGYVEQPFAIVMEYLPGGSLASRPPAALRRKRAVALDVLRALAYMHNRRPEPCLHRDVKPRNILLTRSGTAKLADLGLSKLIARGGSSGCLPELAAMSKSVGTERYAAPETHGAGPRYDAHADMYSTGAVLYELFEGAPFRGAPQWAVAPRCVHDVVGALVSREPARRPLALEAYDALEALAELRRPAGGCLPCH